MFFEPLRTDGFNENECESRMITTWKTVGANCMSAVLQYTKSLSKNEDGILFSGPCIYAVRLSTRFVRRLKFFICLNLYLVYPLDNILRYCIHFSVQYQINLINLISFLWLLLRDTNTSLVCKNFLFLD